MAYNFLNSLDLPKSFNRILPSVRFDEGLMDWQRLRSHELDSSAPPSYAYYADEVEGHASHCWKQHDACFELELGIADDKDGVRYQNRSFLALGDYPARVLSSLAYQLGWRLVPYARWVAKHVNDQSLAFYVETHCRQWTEEADLVFHLLQNKKLTTANAPSHIVLIAPVRGRAIELNELALCKLRRCHL